MTTLPSGSTSTVRIAPGRNGSGMTARTGARVQVIVDPKPFGILRVYAPSVEGRVDKVVLRDSAATSMQDAVYWTEFSISQAVPGPDGASYRVLQFDEDTNTGGRRQEIERLYGRNYTLVYRPLGTEVGERVLLADSTPVYVFSSGPIVSPPGTVHLDGVVVTASREEGDAPLEGGGLPHMTSLVATEARLSDRVRFPDEAFHRVGILLGNESDSDVELRRPTSLPKDPGDPLAPSALLAPILSDEEDPQGLPDATFRGVPVPMAVRKGAWRNGDPSKRVLATPGEAPAPTNAAPPTAETPSPVNETPDPVDTTHAGERWLYVFGVRENEDYRRTLESSDRLLTPVAEHYPNPTFLVGVWRLAGDGTCQLAAYPDGDGADDLPSPVGPTAPFFFLDTGLVTTHPDRTAYVHVSRGPLPRVRLDRLQVPLKTLGLPADRSPGHEDPGTTSMTPLDLVGRPGRVFFERRHAHYDTGGQVWAWYLPDPVRVSAYLSKVTRAQSVRYNAWVSASALAARHGGVVAATCYDDAQGRDHLQAYLAGGQGALSSRGPMFGSTTADGRHPLPELPVSRADLISAWSGFNVDVPGVARPPGAVASGASSALSHFQFGVYRQRSYLRHRIRVAGNHLVAWIASPTYEAYLRDLGIERVLGKTNTVAEVVAVEALAASAEAGGGAGVLLRWLEGAGVFDRLPSEATADANGRALDPATVLDSVLSVLNAPAFDVVWLIAEKGGEAAVVLFEAAGPAIVLKRWEGAVGDYTGRFLGALFASRALGSPPDVSDGGRRIGPLRLSSKDLDAKGASFVFPPSVPGGPTSSDFRPQRRRWTLTLDGPAVSQKLAVAVGGFDVAITFAGVVQNVRRDQFGLGDVIATGQVVTEAAGVAEALGTLQTAGRVFAKGAVVLEAAGAAVAVRQAYDNPRYTGSQAQTDWVGVIGTALEGTGAVLITQAATVEIAAVSGTTAAASGAAAVLAWWGAALVAAGIAIGAVGKWVQSILDRMGDPLSVWLPSDDVWGQSYGSPGHRTAMLELVRPDWTPATDAPAADGPRLVGTAADPGMTDRFVEYAFQFPVKVRVRRPMVLGVVQEDGPVNGLTFQIDPQYLPESGTITLSAVVRRALQQPVPVQCAVHYVRDGRRFFYTVKEAAAPDESGVVRAKPLVIPADGDLLMQAEEDHWAESVRATVEVYPPVRHDATGPAGRPERAEHDVLEVHVGAVPTLSETYSEALTRASGGEAVLEAAGFSWGSVPAGYPQVPAGGMYNSGAFLEVARSAERGAGAVSRSSVVGGSPVGVALGGPFTVAGTAFFRPFPPVDARPLLPAAQARPLMTAVELVHGVARGYRYPQDDR